MPIQTFTSNGTFNVPAGVTTLKRVLIVGGGGGGGGWLAQDATGGGGAGEVVLLTDYAVTPLDAISVVIGAGGDGGTGTGANSHGGDGGNSSFDGQTANGGGGGGASFGSSVIDGRPGGSGGGGGGSTASNGPGAGGASTSSLGDGNDGGGGVAGSLGDRRGGGGGGAGALGASNPGHGGDGIDLSSLFGTGVGDDGWFGGGGGGGSGSSASGSKGLGGKGGGGDGGRNIGADRQGGNGAANTGGGGGGSSTDNTLAGGAGGSGFVLVEWDDPAAFESDVEFDYELALSFASDLNIDYLLNAKVESDLEVAYRLEYDTLNVDTEFDYRILDIWGSDLDVNYEIDQTFEAFVSQLPIVVLANSFPPVRISQLPIVVLTLDEQNTRVTQAPIVPLIKRRPIPLPSPLIPLAPVTEELAWRTAITGALSSKEQRSALREVPRYRISYEYMVATEDNRRELRDMLYHWQGKVFLHPLYHAFAYLDQPAIPSDDRLYFNPAATDLREGEKLALFDVYTLETSFHDVSALHADGCTLSATLGRNAGDKMAICPAIDMRMLGLPTLDTNAGPIAQTTINLESVYARPFERPGSAGAGLLTMVGGLPVVERAPVNTIAEVIDHNLLWLDNNTGIASSRKDWRIGQSRIEHTYKVDRETEMDYWRALFAHASGRWRTMRLPSFTHDLPLVEVPALGATVLTTSSIQAEAYLRAGAYGYIQIVRRTGVIYRRITDVLINYDSNGDPVSLNLVLNSSIGSNSGDNQIRRISFLRRVRFNSDALAFAHHRNYSTLSVPYHTVNE